jgi:hypothetical protein
LRACVFRKKFFHGHGNIHTVVIKSNQHQLHKNLGVNDGSRALAGSNATLVLRKALLEFVVGLVFVSEATHQAPTATADLQWIKGCLLRLCTLHAHWHQNLQEVLAAAVLAALFVIRRQPRLIARADLVHLYTRSETARECWD